MRAFFPALLLIIVTGCAAPIGVDHVGMDRAYEQITATTLTGAQLSDDTRLVLARYGLDQLARRSPDLAVAKLHERACRETRRDVLFALAEISYAAAQQYAAATWTTVHWQDGIATVPGKRAARVFYGASAVYAYLYLFGPRLEAPPDPFDWRFRVACDFYNRGLAHALKCETGDTIELRSGVLRLPMGMVNMEATRPGFPWGAAQFHQFVAADEYLVRGLDHRTRQPGLGVPLIAIPDRVAFGDQWPRYYPPGLKVPATVLLRLHGPVGDLTGGGLKATLELYSAYNFGEIKIGDRPVPLEVDLTAPLAYALESSIQWRARLAQFFSDTQLIPTGLYLPQPYEPGKIPVVFVHGTGGSPSDWANAVNTLLADATLRSRCQFWYFFYNTGNPIAASGALLREGLDQLVHELDPQGKDPALRNMVLAGHSQGGLVVKLAAVRSGDKLWKLVSDRPLEELNLPESDRELLRRGLIIEPSPYVHRVIFVSTPHGGSILVNDWIQNLSQRLIHLPRELTQLGTSLATLNLGTRQSAALKRMRGKVPTSVANMNPDNPFLLALHDLPLAPGIAAHSIIAVKPGLDVSTGNDGVVAYRSAHIEGVESEFVVRWDHSCQVHPLVIEEVRRVLLFHLKQTVLEEIQSGHKTS